MRKEYDFTKGRRGPVVGSPGKTRITTMLDDDIIEYFRSRAEAEGTGYQTMINAALREVVGDATGRATDDRPVTIASVRELLREELDRSRAEEPSVRESPHPAILSREEPRAVAEQHLAKQMALLRDLANYGSNLVIRAFDSSPKKMAEVVTCGVLLKQIVAMVDSAEVLLSAGCGHAAFLPARTAFEASIYADWILKSHSEIRATRYIVGNYRDERLWANRVIPGTKEQQAMSRVAAMLGLDVHAARPTLSTNATIHLAEVNRILAQPELQKVDQEFTALRGKRSRDPEWYELDGGPRSIREMAERVERLPEYEFFYSKGSQVAHTGTYKDHVRFKSGQVRFLPIRHLGDVNLLLNFVGAVAIGSYKKVLERYRPGELPAFRTKYLEDWRDAYQNVTAVKYNF
jgi:hypothetical protein